MHYLFKNIKSVGFDLDNTLYKSTEKIDNKIRNEVARRVLQLKPEHKSVKRVREIFEKKFKEIGSSTKVIESLGIRNPKQVMYECLANADIVGALDRDDKLVNILNNLKEKYPLFLITSSPEDLGISKLEKIGIKSEIFTYKSFGVSKVYENIFEEFLLKSEFKPHEHVYVGDNLNADIIPAKKLGIKTIAVWKDILEADLSMKRIYDIGEVLL